MLKLSEGLACLDGVNMSFYEEVIYMKRSIYRDYHELVLSLVNEYEAKLTAYFNRSGVIKKHCEIDFNFDLSWKPITFFDDDFRWIEALATTLEKEQQDYRIDYTKRIKIKLYFASTNSVEVRIPFLDELQLDDRDQIMAPIWKDLFTVDPLIEVIKYKNSEIRFEVVKGKFDLINRELVSSRDTKMAKIVTPNREHRYEL